ncbi:MAG: hypothetical protein ACOX6P_05670 [Candidatus Merdivicinus sp.]|jgi:hypothetical protein
MGYQERMEKYRRIWQHSPRMAGILEQIVSPEEPAAVIASFVLAPALGGFVEWLLEETMRSGKKRLYFLARDGYFPWKAAKVLCEKRCIPIECRYLSISRYAIRLPLFHRNWEKTVEFLCRNSMHVTVQNILKRASLTDSECQEITEMLGLSFPPEESLSEKNLAQVRHQVGRCKEFRRIVEAHSRAAMPGLSGYLQQEGLLDGISYAIVDSGWVGSMQKSLGEVLFLLGQTAPLEGYYWGLYDLPPGTQRSDYHTYYFGPENGLRKKIGFNNSLLEAVSMAPHGMTLSYRLEKGRYLPCYGKMEADRNNFIQKMEQYLLPYIHLLADTEPDFDSREADRKVIRGLMEKFMGNPSVEEAEIFGRLHFSDDVLDEEESEIAPILTEQELKAYHLIPRLMMTVDEERKKVQQSAWYEGSVVRSGRRVRYHLMQYRLFQAVRYGWKIIRFRRERRI